MSKQSLEKVSAAADEFKKSLTFDVSSGVVSVAEGATIPRLDDDVTDDMIKKCAADLRHRACVVTKAVSDLILDHASEIPAGQEVFTATIPVDPINTVNIAMNRHTTGKVGGKEWEKYGAITVAIDTSIPAAKKTGDLGAIISAAEDRAASVFKV